MDSDIKRIARLTSILTQLLSRKIVSASSLVNRFGVSVRTIYRDIKTLEKAGVPIVTIEGKGYSVVEGYKLPPIMFTEREANALITADLIIQAGKDRSLAREFSSVTAKVRSVLSPVIKSNLAVLERNVGISNYYIDTSPKSDNLMEIQKAVVETRVLELFYTDNNGFNTRRSVEPFALFANQKNEWILVAYCRLRTAFRSFSLVNVSSFTVTTERFKPHDISFQQYLYETYNKKTERSKADHSV
jgi:predicted DNA-binding transcriptional regulator YafY